MLPAVATRLADEPLTSHVNRSRAARERADVLALVKPQFELGPEQVGKGGVVRSPRDRRAARVAAAAAAERSGLRLRGFASSGLPGPKGNRETFMWCSTQGPAVDGEQAALRAEPDEDGGPGEAR